MASIAHRRRIPPRAQDYWQRQRLLIELGRRVAVGDSAAKVMAWVCQRLAQLFRADHCRIVEQLPGSGNLLLRARAGASKAEFHKSILPLAAHPAVAEALRSGLPVITETRDVEERSSEPATAPGLSVSVPLIAGGRHFGVLVVVGASRRAFGVADLRFLQAVAELLGGLTAQRLQLIEIEAIISEHQQLSEDLRQAERRLTSIVESASDIVISADSTGRIATWNRAAERISGYVKEQVIGHHLGDYCAPSDRALLESLLYGFLAGSQQGQIDELCLISLSGQAIPISWRFSPMQNDLGEVTGIVALGRDLRQQRRLETQLFQAAKMASMGVMASGIGHELRNPLGIISANVQLARTHPNDHQLVSDCLQRANAAAMRAAVIIDNLLTFALPGGEERRAVEVNEVLLATIGLLEHQIRQRQINFQSELAPALAPVLGNPALLQQVFTNLILNGCQAMSGGGNLWLSSSMTDDGKVEVAVRDEGVGISEEILPHIFEPFFTTRPVGQGTGLGLAISYSIVQQHGGQIEVSSRPATGSTFIVRLPAAPTMP
jgi:PAS domain S-box-containing protein